MREKQEKENSKDATADKTAKKQKKQKKTKVQKLEEQRQKKQQELKLQKEYMQRIENDITIPEREKGLRLSACREIIADLNTDIALLDKEMERTEAKSALKEAKGKSKKSSKDLTQAEARIKDLQAEKDTLETCSKNIEGKIKELQDAKQTMKNLSTKNNMSELVEDFRQKKEELELDVLQKRRDDGESLSPEEEERLKRLKKKYKRHKPRRDVSVETLQEATKEYNEMVNAQETFEQITRDYGGEAELTALKERYDDMATGKQFEIDKIAKETSTPASEAQKEAKEAVEEALETQNQLKAEKEALENARKYGKVTDILNEQGNLETFEWKEDEQTKQEERSTTPPPSNTPRNKDNRTTGRSLGK